jgi:hypothetical protein
MIQRFYALLLFMAFFATTAMAQTPTKTITDDDLVGGQVYNWTNDTIYLLDGFVYLEDGGILNIQEGTVIKGIANPTTDDLASTLIITKNAQIFAEGTSRQPIIFTAEDDTQDLNTSLIAAEDRGLWGGLIILGNATITDEADEEAVEGLDANDPRSFYGGMSDTDNSGVLRYVSIRHGGAELAPGNEINGLTLGGVGSGTTLEYIEVFANSDDGIEFFGGTANLKYATISFCGDDALDWDTGWRGKVQFISVLQSDDNGDNAAEMDGAKPDANTPSANPQVYNATYVGSGVNGTANNEHALLFRDGTRGRYTNSIFTDFANFAIQVEDRASGVDSRSYMEAGELVISNNVWFGFGEGNELNAGTDGFIQATPDAEDPTAQFLIDHLANNGNVIADPMLNGISRDEGTKGFDPRPATNSPAYQNVEAAPSDDFYTAVDYKGAFGTSLWTKNWTALDFYEFLPEVPERVVTDADLTTGSYNWSADTTYILDGFVYLEDGGSLTIEPGTVIKAAAIPSTDDLASTLIIARGATINACGTKDEPIIFTSEFDDLNDPDDVAFDERGLWGGLIILGSATITDEADEEAVEGLDANDPRSFYGGNDDSDSSGSLCYVSIRHGGAELAPGNEINGLTLGGVGSGTTLRFIEVLANSDDGIEFFGGTADLKYASIAFCGDDALDWDTGWRGRVQFINVLQSADNGDNAAEMDGAKPDANTPSANPQVYNATYVGSGIGSTANNEHALLFRDGTRGRYSNSIFTDFGNFAIQVEDRASGVDSRSYMEAGELVLSDNVWFGFGEGNELNAGPNGFIQVTADAEDPTAQFLIDHLANNRNTIADPQLTGISRSNDGGYNPAPSADGPAYSVSGTTVPADDFYTAVSFKGAFCSDGAWIADWTALAQYGVLASDVTYADFEGEDGCDVVTPEITKVVKDEDLGTGSYTWSSDTTYILDGFVYLEDGGSLTIEPGTVIKGAAIPSTDDLASTLIIARGATINACGTKDEPIIFTSAFDDLNDPEDVAFDERGLWGGLIILGSATITDEADEEAVEGLDANDPRSFYGGNDDSDSSGSLCYVSIRHGGAELAPGNEINGLTLGGVGSGTTLRFIEVLANSDDGIEFFGGTADLKYATIAFCGDDALDWDTGWRGRVQFINVLQSADNGDNAAEMDGAKPDANTPSANPQVYNATYVGSGIGSTANNEHALLFRDGTRGRYSNSIFTDFGNFAIQVEDRASGVDSRSYMEAGELVLSDNVWFGFGEGNELNAGPNGFIQVTADAEDPTAQFLIDHLANNRNTIADPQLTGISRSNDGGYNPAPSADGPAYSVSGTTVPADDFYTSVRFKGAFCSEGAWIADWTALAQYGVLASDVAYADFEGEDGCDLFTPEITKVVTDADLGTGTYTWSADTTYILDGFVYLEDGGSLTIEPGTVIKGAAIPSTDDLASTLIIARGATINACGTKDEPIIFTSAFDDLNDPEDVAFDERGLWGGLIILGNATITDEANEEAVEGLDANDPRSFYGGNDDSDSSGSLCYVSIRHGGAELAPGNEINGLTLGGVGSGTTLRFIEVLANSDDGIEFFGGTADLKYATIAFCGDDALDWDTGWRGRVQFINVLQSADNGDNAAEMDGAKPDANTPSANPQVYNATYVGSGIGSTANNEHALLFRDGTRGRYSNSIFTDFGNFAIQVEDRASGVDSRSYMEAGELVLSDNVWFGFGEGNELNAGPNGFIQVTADAEDPTAQFLIDHLANNRNSIADPLLSGISRSNDGGYNPAPAPTGPAYSVSGTQVPMDDFYTPVRFKGAFCSEGAWIADWTALAQYGVLASDVIYADFEGDAGCDVATPEVTKVITDADLGTGTYTWSSDTTYILDGFVYLEDGGSLTIEPGTVIKGAAIPSTDDLASTLIIARGATIDACGTKDDPIIFTAEDDDIFDPADIQYEDRGLWGGLIILGNATITDEANEEAVEGLDANDPRSFYGGNDDSDSSGSLCYVSIRHGGAELAPGNEINGLTLGGVGSGTTLRFIEVIANSDDGIEFFGGTASIKNFSIAFCGDDALDWDTGWRGNAQFGFVLQSDDNGDNAAEMDGAKPDANTPSANPQIYNVTYVGSGVNGTANNEHALLFRDGTRGRYSNSIFTDFANFAIQVEDRASGVDSRSYMEAGELVISNNIWFGFGEGNELNAGPNGFIQATADAEDPTAQFLIDHLAANGNSVEDPQLGGISRDNDGGLDPRPAMDGPAYITDARETYPIDEDFFTPVLYRGAFCASGVWIADWTALAQYGVLNASIPYVETDNCDLATSTESLVKSENGYKLIQNAPNPVRNITQIQFELPRTVNVSLTVYDINGKVVADLISNERRQAGTYNVTYHAGNLQSGVYFYTLTSEDVRITKPMVVNR